MIVTGKGRLRPCGGGRRDNETSCALAAPDAISSILAQPAERKRANGQAEVAQGDVVVRAEHQQIQDDAEQPCADDIRADARIAATSRPAAISTAPTTSMKVCAGTRFATAGAGSCPVRQKTEELVRTRNDRRDDEPDIERQIGLIAGRDRDV